MMVLVLKGLYEQLADEKIRRTVRELQTPSNPKPRQQNLDKLGTL